MKSEIGEPLLSVRDLKVHFAVRSGVLLRKTGVVHAVDGVSLDIGHGETLGLVGESGCGKSTLGKGIVRLEDPTAGKVMFRGLDIARLRGAGLKAMRREMQMVFQDPADSLNARHSVRTIIEEPFIVHGLGSSKQRRMWVDEALDKVGLPPSAGERFAFEFSGGQRQRIGIARAIALKPKLVVCDEPVSALDVSVQSQVLNLLLDLQEDMGLSYLFIAHDLAVVKHVSDRIAVMYLGKIVELAPAQEIYKNPRHAYTKALLAAIPEPDPAKRRQKVLLEGDVPSPINPPAGSAFGHRMGHARYAESIGMDLSLREIAPGHFVAADPCCLSEEDFEQVRGAPELAAVGD